MGTINRFRVEDMIKEVNDRLDKFSLESGIKAKIKLNKEKNHLVNLLFYTISKDEGFDRERFVLNVRFAFPLSSGKFLGTEFILSSDRLSFGRPFIVDNIEGGPIKNPKMWIVALPNFYLFDEANRVERFRIYDLLEDLGFNTNDYPLFPYIEYSLSKEEYLLEE